MRAETKISRRAVLGAGAALVVGLPLAVAARCPSDPLVVCNVTELYSVRSLQVVQVKDVDDVRAALRRWNGRVAVGGGRYSMGGQTAIEGGWQLDMRSMEQLVRLDPARKLVRVQAGMRWRDLQPLIDPHGLSVRTMQSFSNFTVGGSVSVNCHGRYVGHGPIASTVTALQIVMADGEVLELSAQREPELFYAAIGGYGGLGVITEVELQLDNNFAIERQLVRVPLRDYPEWFAHTVLADPRALMHNADLVPPSFDDPYCVTWRRSEKPLTVTDRLRRPQCHTAEQAAIWAMTELPGGAVLRRWLIQRRLDSPAVVWRNHEANLDVAQLEPFTRSIATYALQEYFVPVNSFAGFARDMAELLQQDANGTLNVSIRHAPADTKTLMSWAPEAVFSFVVYYKQGLSSASREAVARWTRAMIALALKHGGRYYLPYQLHAEPQQFASAYPQALALRDLRRRTGASRFSNALWDRYGV